MCEQDVCWRAAGALTLTLSPHPNPHPHPSHNPSHNPSPSPSPSPNPCPNPSQVCRRAASAGDEGDDEPEEV